MEENQMIMHTPGSWAFEDDPGHECEECGTSDFEAYRVYSTTTHGGICIVLTGDKQKHDARLITAAPDFYEVATLGQQMRNAQRLYFKSRSREHLIESKEIEAAFDKAVEAVLKKMEK